MSKKFYTQEQWIEKAQRVHVEDNYDYSQANYLSSKEKVTILCPLHGPFQQNAREHMKGDEIKRTWCAQNGIKLLEIPYNVRDLYSALIEGLNKEVAYAQQ